LLQEATRVVAMAEQEEWEGLRVEGPDGNSGVAWLSLHRPTRFNALDAGLFRSLPLAIAKLDGNPDVRVIVLTGSGAHFCAGIDLSTFTQITGGGGGGRNQTKKKESEEASQQGRGFHHESLMVQDLSSSLFDLQALFEQQKKHTLEQQTVTVLYTPSACQGKRVLLLNPPTSPHASEGRERSLEGM
jgi:hypothetical protein